MTLFYIILSTVSISLISFVGVVVLYIKKGDYNKFLKTIISLAAGALLAVTFLDLLPEAIEGSDNVHGILITVFVSFLFFFVLERFVHWHHCHCENHGHSIQQDRRHLIITNLVGDGVHNLIDGFLIATAFMINSSFGFITTIAVILHEIPQEISDFGVLLYGGLSKKKALLFNFLFALTAVVGGIVFYYFGQSFEYLIPYFAAFAAGNFLYLSAADLIPELHHEKNKKNIIKHTIWLLLGVIIISLFQLLVSE